MQNVVEAKPSPVSSSTPAQSDFGVQPSQTPQPAKPIEIGGPRGPEPTRYGDWEKKGRCIDF
jgi:hypothetical protein